MFEDRGKLKYWVENLPGGGKCVHLKDFENNTDFVVEDTVPGDGSTDNTDIEINGDDSDATLNDLHGSDVNIGSGSDGTDVDLNDANICEVTVEGDNGTQDLGGDSNNNGLEYGGNAQGNTHDDNGTGSGNTWQDSNNNYDEW